jgi:hypothetical protein
MSDRVWKYMVETGGLSLAWKAGVNNRKNRSSRVRLGVDHRATQSAKPD